AAVDAPGLLEVGDDLLGRVDGHGEADADAALAAAAAGRDLGVDPDHLPGRVDERAARVARVDRRVGLQHVVDLEVVGRLDRALYGRDDAGGEGAFETEGIADGDGRI